jgi:hypothetical protein
LSDLCPNANQEKGVTDDQEETDRHRRYDHGPGFTWSKEEVAMLFSARARGAELFAQIDETTCSVMAMYEVG